jgi:hypothetical protein
LKFNGAAFKKLEGLCVYNTDFLPNEIYPLTCTEIVDAQKADNKLKDFFKPNATLDKGLEL